MFRVKSLGYFALIAFHLYEWLSLVSHFPYTCTYNCVLYSMGMAYGQDFWGLTKMQKVWSLSTKFNFYLIKLKKRTLPSGASAVNS